MTTMSRVRWNIRTTKRPSVKKKAWTVECLEARVALSTTHGFTHNLGALKAHAIVRGAHRPAASAQLTVSADASSVGQHATAQAAAIPDQVDLRSRVRGFRVLPYLQDHNDCTANAVAAAIDYTILGGPNASLITKQGFRPSRLFLYYNARFLGEDRFETKPEQGSHRVVNVPFTADIGSFAADALQSAMTQGIASEGAQISASFPARLPYGDSPDLIRRNPGPGNYLAGRMVRITGYQTLKVSTDAMEKALAAGKPVLFSMELPRNFPGSAQGVTFPEEPRGPLPTMAEPPKVGSIGAHLMLAVGYNKYSDVFIIMNTWGKTWGAGGYAYMPASYVTSNYFDPKSRTEKPRVTQVYTINGVSVSNTPAGSIGTLNDLVPGTGLDRTPGEIHIDTTHAPAAGAATSFDYFNRSQPGRWVTPLIFSYSTADDTYTITGIGRSFRALGVARQGIPFDPIGGSSAVMTTSSVFGFYEGDVITKTSFSGGKIERVVPNAGAIPYSNAAPGTTSWITAQLTDPKLLKVGTTFSTSDPSANVALTVPGTAARTYSAMVNE